MKRKPKPITSVQLMALELLGIDELPLPRMDGFNGNPYLTASDYITLGRIVRALIPGMTFDEWKSTKRERRDELIVRAFGNHVLLAQQPSNGKYSPKKVNYRMIERLQIDPRAVGWSSGRWAKELECSPPSVVATTTWKRLREAHESEKAVRARDRRGRGVGRRSGQVDNDH